MHLSWNEIRVRAASFVQEWWNTLRERSETQSFYNDFFEIFGVKRRTVARYEQHVKKLDNHSGFIDLFWPGVLIVEQKSIGRDLTKAYDQAGEYFDALKESERPRYILVSDFQSFELHDLDERKTLAFLLYKDQEVTELNDEYEITATVVDTEQLNWWLRGFGDAVRGIRKQPAENI